MNQDVTIDATTREQNILSDSHITTDKDESDEYTDHTMTDITKNTHTRFEQKSHPSNVGTSSRKLEHVSPKIIELIDDENHNTVDMDDHSKHKLGNKRYKEVKSFQSYSPGTTITFK